ncbi:hypothetical protein V6N13_080854 [Hibiscus sabdariffa]
MKKQIRELHVPDLALQHSPPHTCGPEVHKPDNCVPIDWVLVQHNPKQTYHLPNQALRQPHPKHHLQRPYHYPLTAATTGNGMDVEDDVWDAAVARLGLVNDKSVWGYVEPEPNQSEHNYPAYEPPAHMYEVDYAAMRDREHEARDRMVTLQADATSMRVRTFDPNGAEFTVEAKVRGHTRNKCPNKSNLSDYRVGPSS